MHAYKNDSGLIDIFYNEPDETITVEEFEARKTEQERQRKIEEHLAALKELGYEFASAEVRSEAVKVLEAPTVPTPTVAESNTPIRARRW